MGHSNTNKTRLSKTLTALCMTCALVVAVLGLVACGDEAEEIHDPALEQAGTQEEAANDSTAEEEATESQPKETEEPEEPLSIEDAAREGIGVSVEELAGSESAPASADGGTSFDSWAPECLDQNGDVTVYAVCELKGWQLEMLMQQQEYSWSTRNQLWVNADSSVAVVVFGPDGEELSDDKIAELGQGSAEKAASYRIVTSRHSNPKKAFDALVGKVMVCEDSEFAETSGVAVAYGPSMKRSLVFVSTSNDVVYLSIYSEDAIAAGLFNAEAGKDLGKTIGETFQTLTGRIPGAEH